MPTAHRIRRLRWRVRAGSRDAAFEVRARLRQLHQADLLEVFQRAFDAAGVGDAIVHLPRLELRVTVADIDAIGPALVQALARQTFSNAAESAPLPAAVAAVRPKPAMEHPPAGVEGLIDYLHTGVLPWPLANLGRTTTRDELVRLALAHRDRVAESIPTSLDRAVAYVFRWLQVTSPAEWAVIARLIGAGSPPAPDVVEPIAALAAIIAGSRPALPGVAADAVAAAILAVANLDRRAAPLTVQELSSLFAPVISIVGNERSEIRGLTEALPFAPVATWIAARVRNVAAEPQRDNRTRSTSASPASARPAPPANAIPAATASEAAPPERPAHDGAPDDDRPGLVVDHAGLVVVHPFLPRLFERLGVASHGTRALDPTLLPRAAALLAYVALGDDHPLDFELGLIKVLLGLRPETVVLTPAGMLSAADREEVDALLHSVIEHWQVLKHTSIAGLRGSFLQRRGLLTAIDGGWRLRVEPDSFDMLIDRLPWALGPIKLPWMTTLLFTEWARS